MLIGAVTNNVAVFQGSSSVMMTSLRADDGRAARSTSG